MIKEELINAIEEYLEFNIEEAPYLNTMINSLFSQNVVIPKGKNRHEYADVLHEWVEGTKVEFAMKSSDSWSICQFATELKYRIKTQEPVYEWQWYYYPCFGYGNTGITEYMTEEAFEVCQKSRGLSYDKIEKSKRERK